MILYCVRHGESAFNAEGRIQGQLDVPLSDFGLAQADAVAEALKNLGVEAVVSSPLQRAKQTAEAVGRALGLPVQLEDRLKEIHAGVFQGLKWSEIDAQYPDEALRWRRHEPDFIIPQGESRRQLMQRGAEAFQAVRQGPWSRAVVVAHGGLLSAALKALLDIPADRNPFSLGNCTISKVDWKEQFRLITLNESGHLAQVNAGRAVHNGDL